MTVNRKTIAALREFRDALRGEDKPGFGTCQVCGRERVKTWRLSTIRELTTNTYQRQQVELCGPCLAEDQSTYRT